MRGLGKKVKSVFKVLKAAIVIKSPKMTDRKSMFQICVLDKLSELTVPCEVELNGRQLLQFKGKDDTFWLMLYVSGLKDVFAVTDCKSPPEGKHFVVGWIQTNRPGYLSSIQKLELSSWWNILPSDPFFKQLESLGKKDKQAA